LLCLSQAVTLGDCCTQIRLYGMATIFDAVCGMAAPSRQLVACDETASLMLLFYLALPLSVQPADRQGQRCMELLSNELNWTV